MGTASADQLRYRQHRRHVRTIFDAALEAVRPEAALARAWPKGLGDSGRVSIVSIGKASVPMAGWAARRCAGVLRGGVVLAPAGSRGMGRLRERGLEVFACDHPVPTMRNVVASRRVLEFTRGLGRGDTLVVLISGGGSAHLCLPREGVGLREVQREAKRLLRSGMTIGEMNAVRAEMEVLKGGGLAAVALAGGARVKAFALSDVMGNEPGVIASGPTWGELARVRPRIIAGNADAVRAARRALEGRGTRVLGGRLGYAGSAREVGEMMAARCLRLAGQGACAVVMGGEATVELRQGRQPKGGRCQESAVAAAAMLEGRQGVALGFVATDGVDGSGGVAGGIVTGRSAGQMREAGIDPAAALERHASFDALDACGGLVRVGATGTNVNDLAIGLVY